MAALRPPSRSGAPAPPGRAAGSASRPAGGRRRIDAPAPGGPDTVQAFCLSILAGGRLADKLRPPARGLPDRPAAPRFIEAPAREGSLVPQPGAGPLPAARDLASVDARVRCLQRFAHHELMAVELFAWALLAWPEAPGRLRRGWLAVLAEEQRHLRLYVDRLAALGADMGPASTSDYFWRHVPALRDSVHGPRAFLAAMGLTYEQANLDFAGSWARAFRDAGDVASAEVLERVHRDEIRHVRLALRWLRRLEATDLDEVAAYERVVPFPLGASRAKGRRFDAAARRRAGLSERFIRHVQQARPAAAPAAALEGPAVPRRRSDRTGAGPVLWPNVGGEEPSRDRLPDSGPGRRVAGLWSWLYGAGARRVAGEGREVPVELPEPFRGAAGPAWPGLEQGGGVAWWPSAAAAAGLAAQGVPLAGCPPDVARAVHDKRFTVQEAERIGAVPDELRPLITFLPAAELRAAQALERLERRIATWPSWTGGRFTLKPRLGTSGRGRAGGVAGRLDGRVSGALARLAAGGGAVLEPWLRRTGDQSVQMLVDADGSVTVLGVTRQLLRPSGAVVGNRGVLHDDGASGSGTGHDAVLVTAAVALASAAAGRGFTGPCGVDAFTYVGPAGEERLRPLVELNARATTGLVALGLLRRARQAGHLAGARAWAFLLRAPGEPASLELPAGVRCLALPDGSRSRHPAILLLSPDEAALTAALRRAAAPTGRVRRAASAPGDPA